MTGCEISECPNCHTRDLPIKQGDNLFLCPFCMCLYALLNAILNGEEVWQISLFLPMDVWYEKRPFPNKKKYGPPPYPPGA